MTISANFFSMINVLFSVGAKKMSSGEIQGLIIVVVMGVAGLCMLINYFSKNSLMANTRPVVGTIVGYKERVEHERMGSGSYRHTTKTYFAVISYLDEYGAESTYVSAGNFNPALYPPGSKINLYIGRDGKVCEKVSNKKLLIIGLVFLLFSALFSFFLIFG